MISLLQLLHSGHLGPCIVGAPVADVVAWLGEGEAFAVDRRGRPRGFAFHGRGLQVGFDAGLIVYFGLYFRYLEPSALAALGVDAESWSRVTTTGDVRLRLAEAGFEWRELGVERADERFELDSGATIVFEDAERLYSILFGPRRSDA